MTAPSPNDAMATIAFGHWKSVVAEHTQGGIMPDTLSIMVLLASEDDEWRKAWHQQLSAALRQNNSADALTGFWGGVQTFRERLPVPPEVYPGPHMPDPDWMGSEEDDDGSAG